MKRGASENPHQQIGEQVALQEYRFGNAVIKPKQGSAQKEDREGIRNQMEDVAMDKGRTQHTPEACPVARVNAQKVEVQIEIDFHKKDQPHNHHETGRYDDTL